MQAPRELGLQGGTARRASLPEEEGCPAWAPRHLAAGSRGARSPPCRGEGRGESPTEGVRREGAEQSLLGGRAQAEGATRHTHPPGVWGRGRRRQQTRPREPPGGGGKGGRSPHPRGPLPSRAHPSAAAGLATGLARRTSFLGHLGARREPGGGPSTRSRPERPESAAEAEHPPLRRRGGRRRRKRPLRLRTPRARAASGASPRLRRDGATCRSAGARLLGPPSRACAGPSCPGLWPRKHPPCARRSGSHSVRSGG